MILWGDCEHGKSPTDCPTCRARSEAVTDALQVFVVILAVLWMAVDGIPRAWDQQHESDMQLARPQIERLKTQQKWM